MKKVMLLICIAVMTTTALIAGTNTTNTVNAKAKNKAHITALTPTANVSLNIIANKSCSGNCCHDDAYTNALPTPTDITAMTTKGKLDKSDVDKIVAMTTESGGAPIATASPGAIPNTNSVLISIGSINDQADVSPGDKVIANALTKQNTDNHPTGCQCTACAEDIGATGFTIRI